MAQFYSAVEERGAHVEYHDPHVAEFREDGHVRRGVALNEETLAWADAVLIVTDHTAVDYQFVVDSTRLVIDTRNTTVTLRRGTARIRGLADSPDGRWERRTQPR